MYRNPIGALAALLTLVVAPIGPAAAGGAQDGQPEKKVVKQKLKVLVGDDDGGEPRVLVLGDGPEASMLDLGLGRRPYLGIGLLDVTRELLEHFGVSADGGILVSKIEADSPAERAGLSVGDVLTAIDGKAISSSRDVLREIGGRDGGETVSLEIWRDGKLSSRTATLATRERSQVDLGRMLHHRIVVPEVHQLDPEHFQHRVLEIETGQLDEALGRLREKLESPEWKARLEEMTSRRHGLEERILELEERLRVMEKRLGEVDG